MRPPRFRVRTLMVAVAVAAAIIGIERRWAELQRLYKWHEQQRVLMITKVMKSNKMYSWYLSFEGNESEADSKQHTEYYQPPGVPLSSADKVHLEEAAHHERMAKFYRSRW